MKCNSCGCENNDQDKFCKNCGMQLVAEERKEVINEIPQDMLSSWGDDTTTTPLDEDDDEGATTLLTSELKTPAEPEDESEANTTVLTSELKTPGLQSMGNTPIQPGGFAPAPNAPNAPMPNVQVQPTDDSGKKKEKNKNKNKTKKGSGVNKVYLVISLLVIVALAGAGAFFFLTHTAKIDDLNAEVASLTDANQEYETDNADKDSLIADYQEQISQLSSELDDDAATIASLQEDISEYSTSSEYYANYNGLINFANQNTGTSSKTFFASDTVLHMTTDSMLVYVYVSENTDVNCFVENTDIATCEWIGWENDNVIILEVTPGTVIGSTKITLTKVNGDSENETETDEETEGDTTEESPETVEIFVYND